RLRGFRRIQIERCAERRMPRKAQFLLHCEDANFFAFPTLSSGITRQNESRFGKIHLTRQRLHLAVIQSSRIGKDRQRITREWLLRENIELNKFICAVRHTRLVHVYPNRGNKTVISCDTIPRVWPELYLVVASTSWGR